MEFYVGQRFHNYELIQNLRDAHIARTGCRLSSVNSDKIGEAFPQKLKYVECPNLFCNNNFLKLP